MTLVKFLVKVKRVIVKRSKIISKKFNNICNSLSMDLELLNINVIYDFFMGF